VFPTTCYWVRVNGTEMKCQRGYENEDGSLRYRLRGNVEGVARPGQWRKTQTLRCFGYVWAVALDGAKVTYTTRVKRHDVVTSHSRQRWSCRVDKGPALSLKADDVRDALAEAVRLVAPPRTTAAR
jgi:hypothetical protein